METATRQSRVGLVLSGGGARGFAHIGLLRALEAEGLRTDAIAGTSIGAILGAFYAAGYSTEEIYTLASALSWRDVIDVSFQFGFIKGQKLHGFLAEHLPATFAELKKPFAVTTTDIESGEEVIITSGDLITALRASACYPGAFEPVQFRGRTLADGGIVNNLPVAALAFLDVSFSIASDTTPPRRASFAERESGRWWERMRAAVRLERRNPMVQMLLRSSDIMQSVLTDMQHSLHPADVHVRHLMPHIRVESFWAVEEIVALGEAAARSSFAQARLSERLPRAALTRTPSAQPSPTGQPASSAHRRGRGERVD